MIESPSIILQMVSIVITPQVCLHFPVNLGHYAYPMSMKEGSKPLAGLLDALTILPDWIVELDEVQRHIFQLPVGEKLFHDCIDVFYNLWFTLRGCTCLHYISSI